MKNEPLDAVELRIASVESMRESLSDLSSRIWNTDSDQAGGALAGNAATIYLSGG